MKLQAIYTVFGGRSFLNVQSVYFLAAASLFHSFIVISVVSVPAGSALHTQPGYIVT